MTDLTNADEQWVRDAGETLVAHTRMNPPSGRCYCGHEVPLGHSFAEHQAVALGDLVAAREAQAAAKAEERATDEYDALLTAQSDILEATVNVLRGDPPELTQWSHHDIAERTQRLAGAHDALRASLTTLSWEMCPQDGKRLRDALGER